MKRKIFSATFIAVIIFAAFFSWLNFQNREYDWDMPGYLGVYYELKLGANPEVVHQKVYSSIKAEASPEEFHNLTGSNNPQNARFHFARNSEAFVQQIPYYEVKFLHNALVFLLAEIGFSPPLASLLPNLIFYFLSSILVFFIGIEIFRKSSFPNAPLLLFVFFVLHPGLRYISTIATPDFMAISLLLLFFFGMIKKYSLLYLSVILFLLMLCRPDFLVFGGTFLAVIFLHDLIVQKKFRYEPILYAAILLATYFGIVKHFDYPGWEHVFYDTFIHRRYFISQDFDFAINQYISVLLNNIVNFKKISLAAIGTLIIGLKLSKSKFEVLFTILLFANIYLKFLMFPAAGEVRFYIGFIILSILWCLYLYFGKTSSETRLEGKPL